jgi:hypothetical protein
VEAGKDLFFQGQNALAGLGQKGRGTAAARTTADHDGIILGILHANTLMQQILLNQVSMGQLGMPVSQAIPSPEERSVN